MGPYGDIAVCGGRSHPKLVRGICRHLSINSTPIEFVDFSNGNRKVKIGGDVRNRDVFVLQTGARGGVDNRFFTKIAPLRRREIFDRWRTSNGLNEEEAGFANAFLDVAEGFPDLSGLLCNADLVELLIIISALHDASAGRITVVMPYMFYVRSDKKDEGRIAVTAKLVAELVQLAGADRVLLMDLHKPHIMHYFGTQADQLLAQSLFIGHFRARGYKDLVVVSGDEGDGKSARKFAQEAGGLSFAIISKDRPDDTENAKVLGMIGSVRGKNCIIHDDELLTGRSVEPTIRLLEREGAASIHACMTHFIASNGAIQRLESLPITELVTTNTIPIQGDLPEKIVILDTAPIFAGAIQRVHDGRSVSELIEFLRKEALGL